MKIPKSIIQLVVGLEAIVLIVVLVISLTSPLRNALSGGNQQSNMQGNDNPLFGPSNNTNTQDAEDTQGGEPTEETQEPEQTGPVFSEAVLAKVSAMTLEQKVAQLFVITPEALTGANRVTVTGNTSKNAIKTYPVAGLIYSANNFQNRNQTASMLSGIADYYITETGNPLLLLVQENRGAENAPITITTTTDAAVAVAMVEDTVAGFKASNKLAEIVPYSQQVQPSGMQCLMLSDWSNVSGIRSSLGYKGIFITQAMTSEHTAAGYTSSQYAIEALQAGVNLIYCPVDFGEAYTGVIAAVQNGTLSEEIINESVAYILTYKQQLNQ